MILTKCVTFCWAINLQGAFALSVSWLVVQIAVQLMFVALVKTDLKLKKVYVSRIQARLLLLLGPFLA